MTAIWERQQAENLFIPTFASGPSGQYLPASALRGALHTAYLFSRWTEGMWKQIEEKMQGDRIPRRPAEAAEHAILGDSGHSRLRSFAIADSAPAAPNSTLVYLTRTSTLVPRGQGRMELGWKQTGRGNVDGRRVEESTPMFCEMAAPGAVFTGTFSERRFLAQPEMLRAMRWREPLSPRTLLSAANAYSAKVLEQHRAYAVLAGLPHLETTIGQLEQLLAETGDSACLLPIGWGGGFLSKVAFPDGMHEGFRKILRQLPYYSRAIQSGLPFPKTRRIVFLNNHAASIPGWIRLDLELPAKQEPLSKQPLPAEEDSEASETAV
jgi:CRISPR-associated protein Csm5